MLALRALLLGCLGAAATAAIQTLHDEAFASVLTSGGYNSVAANNTLVPAAAPAALFTAFAAPSSTFASTGALPTAPVGAASVPLGAFPICVAYNVPAATAQLGVNATDLPRLLGADAAPRAGIAVRDFGDSAAVPDAAALSVFLPSGAVTAAALLRLQAMGAAPNGTLGLMHSRATAVLPTARAAAQRIKATPNSVGVVPLAVAIDARLPCAAWRRVTRVAQREVWAFLPPKLTAGVAGTLAVTTAEAATKSEDHYPLLGPAVVTAPSRCLTPASYAADLLGLLGSAAFAVHLGRWGVVVLPAPSLARGLNVLAAIMCRAPERIAGAGSSAVLSLVAALALEYVAPDRGGPFIDYPGGGSGHGLRSIQSRSVYFASSDAAYSDAEFAQYPTVRFVPATAFAVGLVFNLGDGVTDLTLPACLVLGLFNGSIAFWDDPALQTANPYAVLPHIAVVPVVRSGKSGTTNVFTSGLRALDATCTGGARDVPVSKRWPLSATAAVFADGTSGIIATVGSTVGALGYAGHADALAAGSREALVQLSDGNSVGPSATAVTQALSGASLDGHLRVELGVVPGGYPFTGVTYFVFDAAMPASSNCSAALHAFRFMQDSLTDPRALAVQGRLSYVPIPAAITQRSVASLRAATCGGSSLLAEPAAPEGLNLWLVALPAAGLVVAAFAATVLVLVLCRSDTRDVSNAPRTSPVAFVFTDIQSSTALWAFAPSVMAAGLELHNVTIRSVIARHKAYEVKTVGDAFMVACRDPATAVALAMDLQTALHAADWGTDAFDAAYRELLNDAHGGAAHAFLGEGWAGLRVRVGVHTGECCVQFDAVTKGYDYYGTAVNTAARVQDVGHGGQTVITTATLDALTPEQRQGICFTRMGMAELRGLEEPVGLHTAVPEALQHRQFPDFRASADDGQKLLAGGADDTCSVATGSTTDWRSIPSALTDGERLVMTLLEVLLSTQRPAEAEATVRSLAKSWSVQYKGGVYTRGLREPRHSDASESTTASSRRPLKALNPGLVPLSRRIAPVLALRRRHGPVTLGSGVFLPETVSGQTTDRSAVYLEHSVERSGPFATSPTVQRSLPRLLSAYDRTLEATLATSPEAPLPGSPT